MYGGAFSLYGYYQGIIPLLAPAYHGIRQPGFAICLVKRHHLDDSASNMSNQHFRFISVVAPVIFCGSIAPLMFHIINENKIKGRRCRDDKRPLFMKASFRYAAHNDTWADGFGVLYLRQWLLP